MIFIGSIEENILEVKANAINAEIEIKNAEKITRKKSRRIWWLFLCICFFLILTIALIILIIN